MSASTCLRTVHDRGRAAKWLILLPVSAAILVLPMSVISVIPGSAHLCRGHWKSLTGYLKLSYVSHKAVKYVHFIFAAAILDFWRILTSRDTGSCTIEKLDTENMGIAVEILLLCALEFEICLGVKITLSCRRTSQKTVARTRVNTAWLVQFVGTAPSSSYRAEFKKQSEIFKFTTPKTLL